MKYLELILRCLTALLRVIFPQHPLFPKRQTLPALLLLLLALLSLLMRETEVTLAAIGASLTLFRHDGTPPPHRPPGRTGWVSPATPSS